MLTYDRGATHIKYLAESILKNDENVSMMMDLILANEPQISQRASMVLHHCSNIKPEVCDKYQERLIKFLKVPAHPGIHRSILRGLENRPIKETLLPEFIEIAFDKLNHAAEPIAIKVYAMGVLLNCCKKYPELLRELKWCIEEQFPHQSAGFKSKAKKILKALKPLI